MCIQAIRNIRQDVNAGQDDTRKKKKLKEASMKNINKLRRETNDDINKDTRLILRTKTRT